MLNCSDIVDVDDASWAIFFMHPNTIIACSKRQNPEQNFSSLVQVIATKGQGCWSRTEARSLCVLWDHVRIWVASLSWCIHSQMRFLCMCSLLKPKYALESLHENIQMLPGWLRLPKSTGKSTHSALFIKTSPVCLAWSKICCTDHNFQAYDERTDIVLRKWNMIRTCLCYLQEGLIYCVLVSA